jgi:hypothetical protein
MAFFEKYVASLNASSLLDDEHHLLIDALCAAALADTTGAGLGSLLSRVKFSDGAVSKMFESGTANLAQLLRIWAAAVIEKGRARKWVNEGTAWDALAAQALCRRAAERSLAYWRDGKCKPCGGAGQTPARRLGTCCSGNGQAALEGGGFERERTLDMMSELEGLVSAHSARAAGLLR